MQTWAMILGGTTAFVLLSLWSIRDAFSRRFDSTLERVLWIQLVALVPFLGGIVYVLVGKHRGKKN